MIRPNMRGRLTAADLQLVILLLSRGSAHRRAYLERRLAAEGIAMLGALRDGREVVAVEQVLEPERAAGRRPVPFGIEHRVVPSEAAMP